MKFCIISIMNIKHISMISFYEKLLQKHNIDFDIIYLDRYGISESCSASNKYVFSVPQYRSMGFFKKLMYYIHFRNFTIKTIERNEYDFIIVWRTETAHLLRDYLLKRYKGRYSVDIRDYFYERIGILKCLLSRLLRHSCFSTISSPGFLAFLPKHEYIMLHSINEQVIQKDDMFRDSISRLPIHICFIGYVRFPEIDKSLIRIFANDPRYIMQYFGEGSAVLKEFCVANGIINVEFSNGFNVEETGELLQRADIINNVYGSGVIALDTAISIRFYYSVFFGLPILTSNGTFVDRMAIAIGNGFSVDLNNKNLPDDLYKWYTGINWRTFHENLRSCKVEFLNHNNLAEEKIIGHIQSIFRLKYEKSS